MAKKKRVEKHSTLDAARKAIRKKYGDVIGVMGDNDELIIETVSTGSISLDAALGRGGMALGRVYEVYGQPSGGKTTLAMSVINQAQKRGLRCAFVDAEHSADPKLFKAMGVNIDELIVIQAFVGDDNLDALETLIKTNEVDIAVVDSVSALIPKHEAVAEIGDEFMGLLARLMSKALRKLTSTLQPTVLNDKEAYNPCSIIFINQTREKIGVMYGSPLTTTGGKALKFYSSIRIHVTKGEVYRDNKKNIIGLQIKFQTKKNKTFKPFQVGMLSFYYNGEIDNEEAIVQYAIVYELVKQGGAWFNFGEEKFQGKEKLIEYLKSKPKVLAKLKKDIQDILSKE